MGFMTTLFSFINLSLPGSDYRVATDMENLENSGNLKNCQNLSEFLKKKLGKLRENVEYVA